MTTFQQPQLPEYNNLQWQPPAPPAKRRNVVGIIALVVGILGAIFACVPGALIIGWVLLPIAFVLGLVGLFVRNAKRGTAIAAVIISIVGTIVGVGVFVTVVDNAFSDAFGGEAHVDGTSGNSRVQGVMGAVDPSDDGGERGSRDNPAALGETLSNDDWDVVVNSFAPDVDAEVAAENPYNEPADPGFRYSMVNLTLTYKGEGSQHAMTVPVALVADDGRVFEWFDHSVVGPEPRLDGEMYAGGTVTGNLVFHVPTEWTGTIRVGLGILGQEMFVATS